MSKASQIIGAGIAAASIAVHPVTNPSSPPVPDSAEQAAAVTDATAETSKAEASKPAPSSETAQAAPPKP